MDKRREERFYIFNKYDPNFRWRYFDPKRDNRVQNNWEDSDFKVKEEPLDADMGINNSEVENEKSTNNKPTSFQVFALIFSLVGLVISLLSYYQSY